MRKAVLALALIATIISGCSDDKKELGLTDGSKNASDASTHGINDGSNSSGSAMNASDGNPSMNASDSDLYPNASFGPEFSDPNNPLSKSTIYFMLDSSQVQPEFVSVIAEHAKYLLAHPKQHVVLEGHADERGSREYNVALGEQRAKSVANMMKSQDVSGTQLNAVGYGEEKPVSPGHDDVSWERNRRVELVYQH